MTRQDSTGDRRPFGKVEYIVSDADERPQSHFDFAENPCHSGNEEDCAEWLQQQLTACYND